MPMIKLSIGIAVAACAGAGWFVRKALVRINAWGEKMNEQDAIFQTAEGVYAGNDAPVQTHGRATSVARVKIVQPAMTPAAGLK
jgi:hypothetical protein